VKILVICRPRAEVDPGRAIALHAAEEMAALKRLHGDGSLIEAYSPGGPGAVLIFDDAHRPIGEALASLPLVQHGLIDTEIINLHPFPGFAPAPPAD
jgi:hypothetical protein